MLRMGKHPKPEPTETEKQTAPPPYTAYSAPVQPATPPQPAPPPRPAYTEMPARPEPERPQATRANAESESLAREIKDGTMSGFVGGGTVLSGEAVFKGMLRVDGHLTGSVRSEKGTLIVSSGGRVDADIQVATAKINGTVNGDIVASERLEFGRTAEVHGDIQAPVLVIEQGAVFEGSCRMDSAAKKKEGGPRPKESAAQGNMPQPVSGKSAAPVMTEAANTAT